MMKNQFTFSETTLVQEMGGVYAIKNLLNGKMYIGSTRDFKTRWANHRRLLRRGKHHSPYLQNAYNKIGEKHFVFIMIEACECVHDTLVFLEQKYIDELNPEYNVLNKAKMSSDDALRFQKENMSKKLGIAVNVYDFNGNLLNTFSSLSKASEETGVLVTSICTACKSRQHQANGKLFFYANTVTDNFVKDFCDKKLYKKRKKYPNSHTLKQQHAVNQYDMDGNFIKRWDSIKEAANVLGIKARSNISMCCLGKYKHCKHFIWRYAE